jgi:hypothetical protein
VLSAGALWRQRLEGQSVEHDPTRADTQPALGGCLAEPDSGGAHFTGIVVLAVRGGQIAGATASSTPSLGKPFGMPDVLDPQAAG